MALVVLVLVAAVAVGVAAGGPLGAGETPVRRWPLLVAAVLVQAGGPLFGGAGYRAGLAISAGLAAVFLASNRRLPGVPLVALGLLLNALVVGANGAMPVSWYAAARAGVDVQAATPSTDPRHEPAGEQSRLAILGDVVPVALPPYREVVSVGDCLLAAGLALLVVRGVRPRERVAAAPQKEHSWRRSRASARPASTARPTTDADPTPERPLVGPVLDVIDLDAHLTEPVKHSTS